MEANVLSAQLDARFNGSFFEVYLNGGQKPTGADAVEWAKKVCELGVGELLVTSMDRDGTKQGYDLALTKKIIENVTVPVIASGGAGSMYDFQVILEAGANARVGRFFISI